MAMLQIGQILKNARLVTDTQIQEALDYQRENPNRKLGKALIALGHIDDVQLCKALSKQLRIGMVRLRDIEVDQEVIDCIDTETVRTYNICPFRRKGRTMYFAAEDHFDIFVLDELRFRLGIDIEVVLTPSSDLEALIRKYYEDAIEDEDSYDEVSVRHTDVDDEEDEEEESDAPVIRLVGKAIIEAVKIGASDIHVEPLEKELRIRYRIDGSCVKQDSPPKGLQGSIMQRIKIMSGMDVADRRSCQDGRMKMQVDGRPIDFRVSVIPTNHGESVVMRILDKEEALVDLEELGFYEGDLAKFDKLIKRPNGIILVTGPTGSGKTTTLYASLKKLNNPDVKIITAEDPIEYNLDGINQCQVRADIELTFARILRAMLRQAPNIILVGEIRDCETAEIAIQASLTGHLVFSTLHTNDAPTAITRLIDIGVKPFLVASAVNAAMGQRLIRLLCTTCKEPHIPTATELRMVGLTEDDVGDKKLYKAGPGCERCLGGFKGRKAIYEVMVMNTELRELTFNKAPVHEIAALARATGMTTLQEDGVRKVLLGLTSFEEILSLTHRQDLTMKI